MPTYDYTCPNGHAFEVIMSIHEDNTPQPCELCGEDALRILSSGMALVWAGRWADSGWINGPDGFDDGMGPIRE